MVEGARRPGHDPLRHPVGSLALGPGGWVQTASFAATGALVLALGGGLTRAARSAGLPRAVPAMVVAAGAGLLASAVFVTDPVSSYPSGTPDVHAGYSSTAAVLHDVSAVPVFLGLPVAMVVDAVSAVRRGERMWAAYDIASAVGMLALLWAVHRRVQPAPALVAYGGLLQRMSAVLGLGWLTALAVRTVQTRG